MSSDTLNPNQKKAVEFNGKHLLVLAGAGTGKTHTIISRAAYLINQGVDPTQIQILSFTKKSANEIVWRVSNLASNTQIKQLNGSTFHSWCMDLIKSNPNVFSHSNYTVIDRDDQIAIFKLIYGRTKKSIDTKKLTPSILLDLYSFARNTRLNLTESVRKLILFGRNDESANNEIKEHLPFLREIFTKYQERKIERKYLDYDDILDVVATGLSKNKQARDFISSKYKHILVDEMQDTNPLQWELLMCFQENSNLFCVGDDAQSIYGFRGADFRNVHMWKERMPNSEVQKLEDNYRSTQEILDLSNWLLNSSKLAYDKHLKGVRGSGKMPKIMNFTNNYDEAEWIVNDIIENKVTDNIPYNEHLILTRSAFASRNIEAELISKKVPYKFFGGTTLFKSAHIRDVLSCLRIIDNIYDEIAWMRYLLLWDKVGDVTATKIVDKILNVKTLEECIEILKNEHLKDNALYLTLENISNYKNSPSKAILNCLKFMEETLERSYKNNWDKRKNDFTILALLANKHTSISEFIAEYILDPQLEESITEGVDNEDKVILSTIHSAKGLEAKICYVINVSVGAFPNKLSILSGEDEIEEERRVLYVALTRAKDELYITRNIKTIFDKTNLEEEGDEDDSSNNYYFLSDLKDELAENIYDEKTKIKLENSVYKGEKINEDIIGLDMS
ncbi:MAG TPA: ATP-dependent helicase [Bacteroidales bacterium]|nr:ATP-dependent helicase [Bacteroidales bacterium]